MNIERISVINSCEGLVIFIDELGKFLESAVKNNADIYFWQQLAEISSRSNRRIILIGILHQSFSDYANKISQQIRNEWLKVQGRFVDISLNVSDEEQISIISYAINKNRKFSSAIKIDDVAKKVVDSFFKNNIFEKKPLIKLLSNCSPLHPVTTCLLNPISRQSFGQNQRSIFSFLNSHESFGFQDFLHTKSSGFYMPYLLWDYLKINHQHSIIASRISNHWLQAEEAINRCSHEKNSEMDIRLLKTISVINIFKGNNSFLSDLKLLKTCFPKDKILESLKRLEKSSCIIKKKNPDAYFVFEGSDFDIEKALNKEINGFSEIDDYSKILSLAGIQPVLAKRYYQEKGSMFWLDIKVISFAQFQKTGFVFKIHNNTIGQFLLILPTKNENFKYVKSTCDNLLKEYNKKNIIIGILKNNYDISVFAKEIQALENIKRNHSALSGDAAARREVNLRHEMLQSHIIKILYQAFVSAEWINAEKNCHKQSDLNSYASRVVEEMFPQSPILHNELLNKMRPSTSAIAAQNALLRLMVSHEGVKRLGIEDFPAEGGLFDSILKKANLYKQTGQEWKFSSPTNNDPCNLYPLWKKTIAFLKSNKNRNISLSEVYAFWGKPPFGVKDGMMPILSLSFILSKKENLAIYREKIFRSSVEVIDAEYLSKDAKDIELRWIDVKKENFRLLESITRQIVKSNDTSSFNLSTVDVARRLVAIYDSLPEWSKKTQKVSADAKKFRYILKNAHDPNRLIFDDLLGMYEDKKSNKNYNQIIRNIGSNVSELEGIYDAMLAGLKKILLKNLNADDRKSYADLHARAKNVLNLAGDLRFDAFALRLSKFDDKKESIEEIAGLMVNKPTRDWIDLDSERAKLEISDMSRKFLRMETFARIQGRPQKRYAMGVIVGLAENSAPMCEEFDIADSQIDDISCLVEKFEASLKRSKNFPRPVILAALAKLSASYMRSPSKRGSSARHKKKGD